MSLNDLGILETRRDFLTSRASGLGGIALASLLAEDTAAAPARRTDPLTPRPPHFTQAPAQAAIFVYLAGAPSQYELYTPKPALQTHHGQRLPESLTAGVRFAFIKETATLLASRRRFRQHGESGLWLSDALPHLAGCADDLCMINSMWTDAFNHHPGQMLMCCGMQEFGRPSMGSWLTWGLGSESKNLPGYVVLKSGDPARGGATLFSHGFLPSSFGGVLFHNRGEPVFNLDSPPGVTRRVQRLSLDALADLNRQRLARQQDEEIRSRMNAFELAFRMQSAIPELTDLSGESPTTLSAYGSGEFGRQCLLARRLVERGVRFVNLIHGGWDAHGNLDRNIASNARSVDQPLAALLRDLRQRGLLDSTLVICGSEFGRTALAQGEDGRDHHCLAFSVWLAGGGSRAGLTYGETDEFGWNVTKNPVHANDLQATILRLFGLDHEQLTYRFQGLEQRLTGVGNTARVIPELINQAAQSQS